MLNSGKHTLYTKPYKIGEHGEVKLPDKCMWSVNKCIAEENIIFKTPGCTKILLALNENKKSERGSSMVAFSAVMSYLTIEEALDLSRQLSLAAKDAKSKLKKGN